MSLGAGDALHAGIELAGVAHRAAHGLKGGLDNVVRIAARQLAHVQR